MPNSDNRDLVLRNREDDAVIANSKSKMPMPDPGEHFDVAGAGIAVFGECLKNANGRLTLDSSQLVPSGLRPGEFQFNPNSRMTS